MTAPLVRVEQLMMQRSLKKTAGFGGAIVVRISQYFPKMYVVKLPHTLINFQQSWSQKVGATGNQFNPLAPHSRHWDKTLGVRPGYIYIYNIGKRKWFKGNPSESIGQYRVYERVGVVNRFIEFTTINISRRFINFPLFEGDVIFKFDDVALLVSRSSFLASLFIFVSGDIT